MSLDLIITGGTVVDGTGGPARLADVGIAGDRIAEVGQLDDAPPATPRLEVDGLIVAPGFIDVHSHSDFTLLRDPRAVSSIAQGVTTEVVGNCGFGCAPLAPPHLAQLNIYGFSPDLPLDWQGMAGYYARLEAVRPAVNVAVLVPNGQLRLAVVGAENRPATADERDRMGALLDEALEEGGWGFSTGLEYGPEVGATEEEVTTLCHHTARHGGLYSTHTRNRDEAAVEAIAEAIRSAETAGTRLQISHITPRGGHDDLARALDLVDEAAARGQPVSFDMHTRLFGTTYLKIVLPAEVLIMEKAEMARTLADPAARARLKEFRSLISAVGDWDRIVLLDNPGLPDLSRRSIGEIARERGVEPLDCVYDILLAEIDQLHRPMVILKTYTEELLSHTYRHPRCVPASDATALAPDGPLAGSSFHGAYTWASWFFRRMVRETGTFTLEEGIHMLTGRPAEQMGITDRGRLAPKFKADLAVFDAETFAERGTTFEPNQMAVGMWHLLVNGVLSLTDGALTERRGGQVLRRR